MKGLILFCLFFVFREQALLFENRISAHQIHSFCCSVRTSYMSEHLKIDYYYEEFVSWADEFDNASAERQRMIICKLFKEILVGKGYSVQILMDSSYEQFLI